MHLNGAERQEKKMVESQNMSNFLFSNLADSEKEMCVWQIISVCEACLFTKSPLPMPNCFFI